MNGTEYADGEAGRKRLFQKVEVKVHRLIRDEAMAPAVVAPQGAALLVALASEPRPGWRADGSEKVDDYLREGERGA